MKETLPQLKELVYQKTKKGLGKYFDFLRE